MVFSLDPEVARGLAALSGGQDPPPPPAVGDWQTRRSNADAIFSTIAPVSQIPSSIETKDFHVKAKDGHSILLRWFSKRGSSPGSAIYYTHGGGMIALSLKIYGPIIAKYVHQTGVPFLAVEYRLSPEVRYPVPQEDCYAGFVWLHDHARDLGVDPKRIGIMGDSAGGGLAASVTLQVRQKRDGPSIAQQILIYPMLDDRTIKASASLTPFLVWSDADNETGWAALLGDKVRGSVDGVPETAAPARMTDASGLPPAYIECGQLDLFCEEDIDYARKLTVAGVPCELHIHPGAPHAFEVFAPNSSVTRRAMGDRYRVIQAIGALEADQAKI